MGSIFNMDNRFFRFMGKLADLMILNLVFIACCIPIVTIGPAITALYYMTLKMVRNEESYIVKGFFHSFKQNLKQGIVINLILLAAGILIYVDMTVVTQNFTGILGKVMYVIIWMAIVVYAMVFVYIYPLLSRFFNTIKNTFTNAVLIAIRHLPYTLLLVVLTLIPVFIVFIPDARISSLLMILFILMGFSVVAYCKSVFLARILDQYMPPEAPEEQEPADSFGETPSWSSWGETSDASAEASSGSTPDTSAEASSGSTPDATSEASLPLSNDAPEQPEQTEE